MLTRHHIPLITAFILLIPGIASACAFHSMNFSNMDILTSILTLFHAWLVSNVEALFSGDTGFWSLITMAGGGLAYGVLHTLGPGHGKLVVGTWSLTQENKSKDIGMMIVEIAILHILSAVVAVALVELVLTALDVQQDVIPYVRAVSYLIIAGFGLWIAFNALRRKPAGCASCGHHHGHDSHDHDHQHDHQEAAKGFFSGRRMVSVLVGAPPCSGAALVLLMALAHDRIWSGLMIAGAIAVGMALALGAMAWLAHWGRGHLAGMLTGGTGGAAGFGLQTLSLFGGLTIAGFGGMAFASAWVVLSHST